MVAYGKCKCGLRPSGVYTRGNKRSHTGGKCVICSGLTNFRKEPHPVSERTRYVYPLGMHVPVESTAFTNSTTYLSQSAWWTNKGCIGPISVSR